MEYKSLVGIYRKLEQTTKRLEKTAIISEFLKEIDTTDMGKVVLLLQGKVFPNWDERKIGIASRLVLKAISIATGIQIQKVEQSWKETGDLGTSAENMVGRKKQATLRQSPLSVGKVFDNIRKLAELEGHGSVDRKMQLVAELLTSASPTEARYIIRTLLEDLRVGVGEGSLRDAITWAFFSDKIRLKYVDNQIEIPDRETYTIYVDAVQRAYDMTNDFSVVAESAKKYGLKGLEDISIEVFRPLKVMLALKVKDSTEAFERCGKPVDVEFKLDGFRIQVHKKGSHIELFTRRLENVTSQFPDVVKHIQKHVAAESCILDSEAAGYDPKKGNYLPFQKISQRIKRKYDIDEIAKKFPVELNIFDILYYNGKSMIKKPFQERRKLIEGIVSNEKRKILVVKNLITEKEKEIEKFYQESLAAGNEGIMIKNLEAPYKPGARVNYMVKLKPVMETLDLVIVGAEWGEGKRSSWLSSFTLACVDEEGNFLEVGKVGTGIKEKDEEGISFNKLTEELKQFIKSEDGKAVLIKPKIVVEVKYEEIQKKPTYSSGYALRFPRLVTLRLDRDPSEVSTITMVEDLYYGQKKR